MPRASLQRKLGEFVNQNLPQLTLEARPQGSLKNAYRCGPKISARSSVRVAGLSRKLPRMALVVVMLVGLRTPRVVVQAGEQLGVHACDAIGGVEQPFAVRVFADGDQDFAHRGADALHVNGGRLLQGVNPRCRRKV